MLNTMALQKIAAFSDGAQGGNPAGVWIGDELPAPADMQRIAAEVGFSETAFAAPLGDGRWRVRYFAPESEVPFCGHATIALGAALAQREGDGVFALSLSQAEITVEGRRQGDLVLALRSRAALAAMHYALDAGRTLMVNAKLVTIVLVWVESDRLLHTRNAFASGGVLEDPATGAATAALAGYLRDLGWPHGGAIDVVQGEDMGMRSRLSAEIGPVAGSSIRVSGTARWMSDGE